MKIRLPAMICVAFLLQGCLFANVNSTATSLNVPPITNGEGVKEGMATCKAMFFLLFAWGDCSVETAMKNGDISELHQVNQKVVGVPLIFAKLHTVVKGE